MNIDKYQKSPAARALSREDIESLLREMGSPDKLDLSGQNLSEIDLTDFDLAGANLLRANLIGANLLRANLGRVILYEAILREANLSDAILNEADLRGIDLSEATLNGARLDGADLDGAILSGAKLIDAKLREANLSEANLYKADLQAANLSEANLHEAYLSEYEKEQLFDMGVIGLDQTKSLDRGIDSSLTLHIRIIEEPLTTQNFMSIISALSELYTKCWLIQQSRLSDLIDYIQTHNSRFSEESPLIISKLTYNSPADLQLKPNVRI